mmetsp:Transcript_7629/g.12846  ORF Transcript_7629/g.12846 Transcript_7629/m.12846 type:complete len:1540 (+) Transcript_7629:186-4805(+)
MIEKLRYIAFGGMCFLAIKGNDISFSSLSAESLLFCFCVIVVVHEMMTDKLAPKYDVFANKDTTKKDFSEFETFAFAKKKSNRGEGGDHILHRVTQDWKMDMRVAQEVSKLIKLVVRDYVVYWFVSVSKRTDFIVDVEEILTNAICTFVRRGKDLVNPYMFVGDKVCDVLVRTMALFRCACQKVQRENPDVDQSSRQFHMLVANEFRNKRQLHIALMASGATPGDDKNTGKDGNTGSDGSHSSEEFKNNMVHSTYHSASDLSMEEFFDADRMASIESEYSFYVGGFLTKYLMDSKEEGSKAGRHLFTEILSNIVLGSVYWLCTPSSVYYYIHMGVAMYSPEVSTSPDAADGMGADTPSSISEIDLHIGMKEYFVGVAGEEKVSSSCCLSAIEAAAAIVLRESTPREEQSSAEANQLPAPGHFIIRQCVAPKKQQTTESSLGLSLLPALLCISYIRHPSDANDSPATSWQVSSSTLRASVPSFDTIGMQLSDFNKLFSAKKDASKSVNGDCTDAYSPISFHDDLIGHVVFLTHTDKESGLSYNVLSCSHQADLKAAVTRCTSNSSDKSSSGNSKDVSLDSLPNWTSLEDVLQSVRYVVPGGLLLADQTEKSNADRFVEDSQKSSADDLQEAEDMTNEKTLLLVEKNILLNHELEGAVEEYLGKKFAPENKIIQISSNDEDGKQAIKRIIEALQNVCMHGWLKKRFVTSHAERVSTGGIASCREEGGRHIATSLSKMFSKILLKAPSVAGEQDNTYEEFLNKSPVLWLWLSHTITHCQGPGTHASKISSLPGPSLSDNSIHEKLNISQRCKCLSCNDTNCYIHSMEIFLENHGSFFVDKEITLETFFECILFCALQTGKLVDVLEITSLVLACEGDYSAVDALAAASLENDNHRYDYLSTNVKAVKALARHDFLVVPADQYAEEAALRTPVDSSRALSHIMPLRDHYLHYFKGSMGDSGRHHSHDVMSDRPPHSPQSSTKEKKRSSVFKSMSLKTFSAATSLLDDISSLTSNRTPEPEQVRPRHLTFSTNMDIIQVSNIKIDTAQEKWRRKIGEGALFGSELQRKAEVAFVLRILLRDRPPLEILESRRIMKPRQGESSRFSSFNIEILKYEKLVSSSSGQQVVVYYIDVYRKRPNVSCPVHLDPGHDDRASRSSASPLAAAASGRVRVYSHKCTCRKWTIKRRYTDFDELHKHLKGQLSSEKFNEFKLPQKAYVQVVQSSFFYAKRLMGLREYLRSLLIGLPDMAEMNIFLAPDDDEEVDIPSQDPSEAHHSIRETVSSTASSSNETPTPHTSIVDTKCNNDTLDLDKKVGVGRGSDSLDVPNESLLVSTGPQESDKTGNKLSRRSQEKVHQPESSTTSTSASTSASTGGEENDKQQVVIDSRTIDLLETRVYALVDELLEVDGMSVIKKNIVSLLCKSIGIFFNGTFIKWMRHQSMSETAVSQISSLLSTIRELFWPNDVLIVFGAAETDEIAQLEADEKLRSESLLTLNTLLPNILQVPSIVLTFRLPSMPSHDASSLLHRDTELWRGYSCCWITHLY